MNNYSNIIDIPLALFGIDDYVIVKKSRDFPSYFDFDDVDIFCLDQQEFINKLNLNLSKQIDFNFSIKMTVKECNVHIDIWPPNASRLNLRFDIYKCFPYKKFNTKPEYYKKIIKNRKVVRYHNKSVLLPNSVDDIILRFFEWVEKPEKTKHLDFVKKYCRQSPDFFNIIEHYTNINDSFFAALKE